jgi:SPP1 family predicted phage head-tail adaptor
MDARGLHDRVAFQRRGTVDDGYGNVQTDTWTTVATIWAAFRPQFGKELLEAQRLQSTTTGTLRVRRSAFSTTITADDRAMFIIGAYKNKIMNIRSIVPSMDNTMIEFVVEEGVVV